MNALSALRSLAYPALRAEPPAKNPVEAAGPGTIPAADLEKIAQPLPPLTPATVSAPAAGSFDGILRTLVTEVNDKQLAARDAVQGLLSGQNVSLHQAMIGMEEAAVSFQLMVEVRNKLLESYQELMRMQV